MGGVIRGWAGIAIRLWASLSLYVWSSSLTHSLLDCSPSYLKINDFVLLCCACDFCVVLMSTTSYLTGRCVFSTILKGFWSWIDSRIQLFILSLNLRFETYERLHIRLNRFRPEKMVHLRKMWAESEVLMDSGIMQWVSLLEESLLGLPWEKDI